MNNAIKLPDEFIDLDLSDINQPGSQYTTDQRLSAVLVYMSLGNLQKTSEALNIPKTTLFDWKKSNWWAEIVERIRTEKRDEFDAGFTRIIDKCVNNIEKKLDTGDVSARDSATIMGITFDKRQVLNNQPTSITKSLNLKEMHSQFERFINAKEIESTLLEDGETD